MEEKTELLRQAIIKEENARKVKEREKKEQVRLTNFIYFIVEITANYFVVK